MRSLPETANRPDWPRLVAQTVNRLIVRLAILDRNFADDAAAAAGGVGIGELYHSSGAVRVRIS